MIRRLLYSKVVKYLLTLFFCIFYDRKYLRGYYFETKRMGYYWCVRSLINRLFGDNRKIPWPVNPRTIISSSKNIIFEVEDLHVFQLPVVIGKTMMRKFMWEKDAMWLPMLES